MARRYRVRQSVSEFGQLVLKATLGVGVPLGIAEDIVQSVLWLQIRGFVADRSICHALTSLDLGDANPGKVTDGSQHELKALSGKKLSSVYLSTFLMDTLQTGWPRVGKSVTYPEVDSPLLVFGALAWANNEAQRTFRLQFVTDEQVFSVKLVPRGVTVHKLKKQPASTLSDAGCFIVQNVDTQPSHDGAELVLDDSLAEDHVRVGRRAGLTVDATSVACLKAFADRMLVLESDRSLRQGAGAGVIDAD
jgi:hypothetical protein